MTDRPRPGSRSPLVALVTLVAVALATVALSGCSGGAASAADEGPPVVAPGAPGEPAETLSADEAAERAPGERPPGPADLTYMDGMVEHHGQALVMTELALEHAESDDVRRLAERIEAAQTPEIEVMRAWLERHDDLAHGPGENHGEHGDHAEHGGMAGMASAEELARLADARGADFDQLFLTLMVRHHEGAVTMAAAVLGETTDEDVERLATDVIASQSSEIARMADLR
ncbi:DUF305 domain-containing protein [Streptomyces profundus]|uniref:DUF305 domain-containing protein n=1 Tax=Streptomyces profundus TaxID=2867410 RepID=UPI001D161B11|nr:DUF305 domain-containing protein [Streptomyces sp. MA3_2.13]UED82810.1 DUF305 domain-containing protein [Streptomyces sp. MA3_2.13]